MSQALSEQEIERRKPVWLAMSALFLDTEISSHDYQHIARAITAQGYTASEARVILCDEVFPALVSNLLSVAGEWAGFPEEFVWARVLEQRSRVIRPLAVTAQILGIKKSLLRDNWPKIQALLADRTSL